MSFIKLYIYNQCLPSSEIVKGYLILDNIFVLHVWIKNNNKIHDFGYLQFLRNNGVKHLPYRLSIEEPKHLKIMDDNYEEFYTTLKNFDRKAYYNNAPHNIKKCIKAVRKKYEKINHC